MNVASLPQSNDPYDDHRPATEFWGPIRLKGEDGVLRDAAAFPSVPSGLPQPAACLVCEHRNLHCLGVIYGYPLYRCKACDVGFVWPQPADEMLRRFYGPAYWSTYMHDTRTLYERQPLSDQIFRRQAQFFDRLIRHATAARVLDVGAGDGTMLRLLADLGYSNTLGLDLDEQNCDRARERLGVTVRRHDFLEFEEAGWDAITLWAVIEHLKDPAAYARHAFRLLQPGGLFVLMTGDNASACARLQGCFDMWLYPPEHLFFFGRPSLRRLLRGAGFSAVRCRVGYQAAWKERLLILKRLADSAGKMLRRLTRPLWRSTASNLLVAWGRKPEKAPIARSVEQ